MQNQTVFAHHLSDEMPGEAAPALRAILAAIYLSGCDKHWQPIAALARYLEENQNEIRRAGNHEFKVVPVYGSEPRMSIIIIKPGGGGYPPIKVTLVGLLPAADIHKNNYATATT